MRVLVVDDNEINRRLATAALSPVVRKIDEAIDGYESLEILNKRKYDLIIMDISMPGLTGIDVMREIRRNQSPNQDTPAIAWTAHSKHEVPQINKLFQDYAQKPTTVQRLREMVNCAA